MERPRNMLAAADYGPTTRLRQGYGGQAHGVAPLPSLAAEKAALLEVGRSLFSTKQTIAALAAGGCGVKRSRRNDQAAQVRHERGSAGNDEDSA